MDNDGPSRARVLMVTLRRLNTHAAWCANYAFEDVIRSVDDVDMLELEPAPHFELRQHIARSLAWRSRYRAFQGLNPGVKRVRLNRDYDVLVFVCMNVWDLLYLNAVADWQTRCKVKLCYMAEILRRTGRRAPTPAAAPRGLRSDLQFLSRAAWTRSAGSWAGRATTCRTLSMSCASLRIRNRPRA